MPILGALPNPAGSGYCCFPTRNRPETLAAVAEYQDVRDASGGTNPGQRFLDSAADGVTAGLQLQRDRFAVYPTGADQALKIRVRSRFLE